MKRMLLTTIGIVALLAMAGTAGAAGNAAAGKTKAATCAGCHEGAAPNGALAGISEDKFVQAMQDYKSGKRPNPLMKGLAASLSDADMADLGAYYASLKK